MYSNNLKSRKTNTITYSLTPGPFIRQPKLEEYIIPQINQISKRTTNYHYRRASLQYRHQGSRKSRLQQQKATEIQKSNRMLYEKIRKIMQKGSKNSHSQIKLQRGHEPASQAKADFLITKTTKKQVSLPQVSNHLSSMRSTQSKSQLSSILQDRNSFMQKYFDNIYSQKETVKKVSELGQYGINNWKVNAVIVDQKIILLKGTKGKRQVTKKYIWEKVKMKLQDTSEQGEFMDSLKKWIQSKFQFEL